MNSEEYLQKVTLGGVETLNAAIFLSPYDPAWPAAFEREADGIRAALGGAARAVEHVGSTSVPGLCAKPILDILLLVADSAAEGDYIPALQAAGYALRVREPDWFEHRMLRGRDPAVNLHVFSDGCPEANRMRAFRDWLRAHPVDRERYAAAKRRLAARSWEHVQNYADAKTDVVREILSRACAAPDSIPKAD